MINICRIFQWSKASVYFKPTNRKHWLNTVRFPSMYQHPPLWWLLSSQRKLCGHWTAWSQTQRRLCDHLWYRGPLVAWNDRKLCHGNESHRLPVSVQVEDWRRLSSWQSKSSAQSTRMRVHLSGGNVLRCLSLFR